MNSKMLVEALKKELKNRRITYKELAKRIHMSEAGVKRIFSEQNFSLQRLDEVCLAIGIDYSALILSARFENQTKKHFSEEVESELALDSNLLLLLYHILLEHRFSKILNVMNLDKIQLYQLARKLEVLGLIDVLPNNHFRAKVDKSTRWIPDGALSRKYASAILEEFFSTRFQQKNETQDFLTGVLCESSFQIIKNKMTELFQLFDQLSTLDSKMNAGSEVFWLYSGMRPWEPIKVIERATRK